MTEKILAHLLYRLANIEDPLNDRGNRVCKVIGTNRAIHCRKDL